MPNWGGGASGAASGAGIGTMIMPGLGTGIGAGIGGLLGLFKHKNEDPTKAKAPGMPDDEEIMKLLKEHSAKMSGEAGNLSGQGTEALAPVMDYFKKLLSGDPNMMMEATRPERGRVIDQYDTARKAVTSFAPRGGGQTSAVAGSFVQEAQQLGDVTSSARKEAVGQAGQLGATLKGLGLSADDLATKDLNSIISAVMGNKQLDLVKRGQNMAMVGELGQGLGSLLGTYLTRGQG
jgi:hypothetical protein